MADPLSLVCANNNTYNITSLLSLVAAILSGFCAFLSYKLSQKIRNELKSDEELILSKAIHPGLTEPDHNNSVLMINVFNKSKRKNYIDKITALNTSSKPIEISYSNKIDSLGNPISPCGLIGIVDTEEIYIRRNDGEWFSECSISIHHSFCRSPATTKFNAIN